jgi:hypothetical protein
VRPAPSQGKPVANKAQQGNAGHIILGQQRHVKRMKEEQLGIGTWNVNTMLPSIPCSQKITHILTNIPKCQITTL